MRRNRFLLIGGALLLAGLIIAANLGQFRTLNAAQKQTAQQKALDEAGNIARIVPEIDRLLKTHAPSATQVSVIKSLMSHGDISAIVLFDRSGNRVLSYESDAWTSAPVMIAARHTAVKAALTAGAAQVSAAYSEPGSSLPSLYSTAYVPFSDDFGVRLGVVGVSLDMSGMVDLFYGEFIKLSVLLSIVFTLVLIALSVAFLLWRDRAGQSRKQVDYLARYDQLTGVHNRGGFHARLSEMRLKGQILPARTAVFYFDLDNFKSINDTHGHRTGDDILRHVGEVIRNALGVNDIAGRLGGDEFVVIAQIDTLEHAIAHAEALQAQIARPVLSAGTTIISGASIGILFGITAGGDIEEDIHRADLALYQAKMDGRNTFRVFSSTLEDRVNRRIKVETAVNRGLEDGLFRLVYQPIIHRATGQCAGFEALLRLTDTDGVPIAPKEFIPVAEANGAIRAIGSWVLDTAIAEAARWADNLFVSVNMSARQFDDENLVDAVRLALETHGLDADRLELEVTESLLIDNTERVGHQLKDLRDLGVSISMDDFGTGYSSLGYLWQYGFDKIKIDRSFVLGLDAKKQRVSEILETIIMLGHRFNLEVTAEGIETETQARLLSDLGCDQFQGYLFGRPMPPENLPGYLLKNRISTLAASVETKVESQKRQTRKSRSTA